MGRNMGKSSSPLSFMEKCSGISGEGPMPTPPMKALAISGLTSFAAMGALSALHFGITNESDLTLILGSFGASAVLIFAAPIAPFSQPRNVIGGHILSAGI